MDGQINAFVSDGQRIFVYTGLLMRADRPNEVIGVLAHETGHIAGGHLVRFQDALEDATAQSIIGFILGTAGAVISRNGDVAAAGALAGESMGLRTLFAYSIGQEGACGSGRTQFSGKRPVNRRAHAAILSNPRKRRSSCRSNSRTPICGPTR